MQTSIKAGVAAMALGIGLSGLAYAQPENAGQPAALKRTMLQTFDVPDSNYKTMIGISELSPNQTARRESHPGPEGGYVLQGSGTILVDGQPPLQLEAGQSYQLAPGAVHGVKSGADGVRLMVIWVVDKDEPFATPAE